MPTDTAPGYTVADLAARYRVSPDKIRAWIGTGALRGINVASVTCGRPRWIVTADALAEFERGRAGGPAPAPPRRPRKRTRQVEYY